MAIIRPSSNPFLGEEKPAGSTPPPSQFSPKPEGSTPRIPLRETVSPPPLSPRPTSPPAVPVSSAPPEIAPQVLAPRRDKKRIFLFGLLALLLIGLIGGGVFWWFQDEEVPVVTQEETTTPPTTTPVVETEEIVPEPTPVTAEYTSENFKAGEIVFGGEALFLQDPQDSVPLEIDAIRGEAFTEKNKQEVKLVVSWRTSKLALSSIEYAKGVGQAKKTVSEDDYSFNHSLIITGLDPASTYLYTIKSTDRFGNTATSEPHAVFTGARTVSLFDLIAGAIGDVFGWAVDK